MSTQTCLEQEAGQVQYHDPFQELMRRPLNLSDQPTFGSEPTAVADHGWYWEAELVDAERYGGGTEKDCCAVPKKWLADDCPEGPFFRSYCLVCGHREQERR
jgi:hypothetical protein